MAELQLVSAEEFVQSVFLGEDSDILGGDSSNEESDGVYAYASQQHFDPT